MSIGLFPKDFLWGAATSAFQVEGSPLADGAGPSDWYEFTRESGRIVGGATADVACDHYRRYRSDIDLMAELGLKSYRFSISWSRIFPYGHGRLNMPGLDFYKRLIDALREKDIEPFVTLYHWDLPAALARYGGWTNIDTPNWFGDYAHTLFRKLGADVRYWATLNEPWVVVDQGYLRGLHPPAKKNFEEAAKAIHNLLRAHGNAVNAFRSDPAGQIGIVVNLEPKDSATDQPQDISATALADAYMNRLFLDPIFLGAYPNELRETFSEWPCFSASDMKHISQPIDFLGVNYYTRSINRADYSAIPIQVAPVMRSNSKYTEMGWEVYPDGLLRILLWVRERYGDKTMLITENGAAFTDYPGVDGLIRDCERVNYVRDHLDAVRRAMKEGVRIKGYFVWSLFDNFEWAHGYDKRFGLVRVDFDTQQRTPKWSAYFYRDVIESRGSVILNG